MNEDQGFKDIQFMTQNIRKKKQFNYDLIQPWMDEPETIPFHLLKTQSQKFTEKPAKFKKHQSLQINMKSLSLSPRKQARPSKQLPKKNIGNFTIVRIKQQRYKEKQILKKKRKSQVSLPALSVARQLAIQRKLFLMKHKDESPPPKRKSIRSIVDFQPSR